MMCTIALMGRAFSRGFTGTSAPSLQSPMNKALAFDDFRERDRTKHVHRLHPYKGKFIPQLVEYFLDRHTDDFKREAWFEPGDVVIDPFCGSGTTLVQANELGIHAIGADVSDFNALISNVKVRQHDLTGLESEVTRIHEMLDAKWSNNPLLELDLDSSDYLESLNKELASGGDIDDLALELRVFYKAWAGYYHGAAELGEGDRFVDKWYLRSVLAELEFIGNAISDHHDVLRVVLCRTARTCRATTHADLATLTEPIWLPYHCRKHKKFCRPLLTASYWWHRYAFDTVARLTEFAQLRTPTEQVCLVGDARSMDWVEGTREVSPALASMASDGVKGVFTSPPYVGLIDYHEQHAYAYELLGLERRDADEIGSLSAGTSQAAKDAYVSDVSQVLGNCMPFLVDDCQVFVVANDKFGLYPEIASRAGLRISGEFQRPVLCRAEKDRQSYSETIFRMERA